MKLLLPMRAVTLAAFLSLSLAASSGAQQLWTVDEVVTRPAPPVVLEGVATSTAATTSAPAAEVATVQVAYDYLRAGMGYLELPLWDGAVIEAENTVFEDRGAGNLMWTGEIPGTGYENVLFTVQDGHLVGWFGKPGGPNYVIHTGPDGRGTLAVEPNLTGDWCGTDHAQHTGTTSPASSVEPPFQPPGRTGHHAGSGHSSEDHDVFAAKESRLDILVLYPTELESAWNPVGGISVAIQQLSDYLNLVLRNNELAAVAQLIARPYNPGFSHGYSNAGHYQELGLYQTLQYFWNYDFSNSRNVHLLRERYKADLIHYVTPFQVPGEAGGMASLLLDPRSPVSSGWSVASGHVFAHEIGHNLGGLHDPESYGRDFPEIQRSGTWDYRFGYRSANEDTESSECSTVMAVYASRAPFYSSATRILCGKTIGLVGTSEVERVLTETIPVVASSGNNLPQHLRPAPASTLPSFVGPVSSRWTSPDTLRISLPLVHERDDQTAIAYVRGLKLKSIDGTDRRVILWWPSSGLANRGLDNRVGDIDHFSFLDDSGATTNDSEDVEQIEISGLMPGARYRIYVDITLLDGIYELLDGIYDEIRIPSYDYLLSESPAYQDGSLVAPAGVNAEITGLGSVRLRWSHHDPDFTTSYSVYWRKWSGERDDKELWASRQSSAQGWERYGTWSSGASHADVFGLVAEDTVYPTVDTLEDRTKVGRYSFVVVAHRGSEFRASRVFDLEFMPGPYTEPTVPSAVSNCRVRQGTVVLKELWGVDVCVETPDGARRRAWDYGLNSGQSALVWFFEPDNVEILVKIVNGCKTNGHHWVFVAPVTTLSFRLHITPPEHFAGAFLFGRGRWKYDSERRPQDRLRRVLTGNKNGQTAQAVSDTTAFRCTAAELAAARRRRATSSGEERGAVGGSSSQGTSYVTASASPLAMGAQTDCEPGGTALELLGGYTVSMCYETSAGAVGNARDFGLDSSQSGLLYFFERDNVEVLIKVLDGCGVNGHRWVFVAPVTELAFNLHVTAPDGEVWTHTNRLGQTADAASDTAAFPCRSA